MSAGLVLFTVSNIIIVLGYLFVAFFVTPGMDVRKRTAFWGSIFFITCAFTHLELAVHAITQEPLGIAVGDMEWHMVAIHAVQAFSVWGFVTGLYQEFVREPRRKGA